MTENFNDGITYLKSFIYWTDNSLFTSLFEKFAFPIFCRPAPQRQGMENLGVKIREEVIWKQHTTVKYCGIGVPIV